MGYLIQEEEFKSLIKKELRLCAIARFFGCSTQYCSLFFKKYYGYNYREYRKNLKVQKHLDGNKEYRNIDVLKIKEIIVNKQKTLIETIEKLYFFCVKNDMQISIQISNYKIKKIAINDKLIVFREYTPVGKTAEENFGFYRIKPPKNKYDILIVSFVKKGGNLFFVIKKDILNNKKSVNFPLNKKSKSKYTFCQNNWDLIKT